MGEVSTRMLNKFGHLVIESFGHYGKKNDQMTQ